MTSTSNAPGRIFYKAYMAVDTIIPFDPKWCNGTGYFDGAVSVPLKPGKLANSLDLNCRRLIFIGTRFGTIVVFDRFVDQTDGGVYVTNHPNSTTIRTLLSDGSVGEGEMALLLGGWGILEDNIGNAIEKMAAEFLK